MALDTGIFVADANLILDPTNYITGGTDLGKIGSAHIVAFNKDVTMFSHVLTGSQFTEAAIYGINLVYEIILQDRSTNVMNLFFDGESGSDVFEAYSTYLPGQYVGDAQTHKLLIRPIVATKPYLYIPRAMVIDLGPVTWDKRDHHQQNTLLTIVALFDSVRGAAFHYGDQANLAAI